MELELSIQQLSDRTGEPLEELRRWQSLGLVGRNSDDRFLADTAAVTAAAEGLPDVEFVPIGKRLLKGLTDEIDVFRAQPRVQSDLAKVIDPVCGMELRASEVTTRLSLEGRELAFCCEKCLRQFIAAPERYSKETAK